MKTLGNTQDKAEVLRRLRKVNPESRRRWGRMSASQMVCHLNDSFRVALGEKTASSASGVFDRTLIKWIALRTPLRWPPGVKTMPEVDQEISGTQPTGFEKDLKQLEELVQCFTVLESDLQRQRHPIFGRMSREDWLRWGYRHMDHHLRQFGV
jgi:hypothetical protein